MAKIKIRGRLEPIIIDNERAKKVKERKFGTDYVEKAESTDVVDLGEWSGEYSRIVEIEMTRDEVPSESSAERQERERKEADEKWLKLTPKQRGHSIGRFCLAYSVRIGDFKTKPPEKMCKQVREIQATYYESEPKAMMCPPELYEALLPKKRVETLAEKMDMNAKKPNGKKCPCGKDLTGNQEKHCSGKCMLADENGELST